MCTFISLTINVDADLEATLGAFAQRGFRFEEAPSPRGLPAGRRYLVHDSGHCDCGTAVGSALRTEGPPYDAAELAKLRRQGWSEARIARWAQQKIDAEAKNERAEVDRLRAAHDELAGWTGLIRSAFDVPNVRVVGIMHDFYASGPGYDDLPLAVEQPRPIAKLDEATLFRLPGGVLVEWTR